MTEESLLAAALEHPDPADRSAFLRDTCEGDEALLRRVEALLTTHDQTRELAMPGRPPSAAEVGTMDFAPSQGEDSVATMDHGVGRKPVDSLDRLAERSGDRIGPYTLGRTLGEGGMGAVFLAHQEKPVRRDVALKVIKAGMDTRQVVARFDAERQALAIMDHPNIARVLDAGATDTGRPFFVMELVDGTPITEYCDARRLTTRQRLELLIPVCQAIQHAHQKGVIHRDLKPSNVLVAEVDGKAAPKVIDFGIAKAIDQGAVEQTFLTQQGAIVGTPEYMSPEQAGGAPDIDTRTDVYALGVLLYELLTGSTPLGRDRLRKAILMEMLRRVREEEPPKPSTRLSDSGDRLAAISAVRDTEPARLTRMIRGDLDWVTMKALEKDRSRRYGTAADLAADLRSYLDGDPVVAGPPTRRYRLSKFARKHRAGLATAGAFALLLIASTAVSAWQAVVADRARQSAVTAENLAKERLVQVEKANAATTKALAEANAAKTRADEERAQAETVSDFLVDAFRKPDPKQDGRNLKVVDLLDGAARGLGDDFKGSAKSRVALRRALGRTYASLGLHDRAVTLLEQGSREAVEKLGPDHRDTLWVREELANAYGKSGRNDEAIPILEAILKLEEAKLGPDHSDTLITRNQLAIALRGAGRRPEALKLYEANLKFSEAKLGPDHPSTINRRGNLAIAYGNAGRLDEAIRLQEATLRSHEATLGPDHVSTLMNRGNLAAFYARTGRLTEAIQMVESTLKTQAAKLGDDHPATLSLRTNLAAFYAKAGRHDEAVRLYESTLKDREAKLGREHPDTVATRKALAQLLKDLGRAELPANLPADVFAR